MVAGASVAGASVAGASVTAGGWVGAGVAGLPHADRIIARAAKNHKRAKQCLTHELLLLTRKRDDV